MGEILSMMDVHTELCELSLEGFLRYPILYREWDPDSPGWGEGEFLYLSAREKARYGRFWAVPLKVIAVACPATVHGGWKRRWHQAAVPIPPGHAAEDLVPVRPALAGWREFFEAGDISPVKGGYRASRIVNGWKAVLRAYTGPEPEIFLSLWREDIFWLKHWGEALEPPPAEEVLKFFEESLDNRQD